MKPLRCLFALALLVWALPAYAEITETERVHKVVPITAGGTLRLNNFSGRVRITGADVSEVTIDAVRRAPRERLDHIHLDIEASGSNVRIEANERDSSWRSEKNNVVETDFTIQVPKDVRLDIHVFSSPVEVNGVTGRQTIKTFSGSVRLDGVAAAVRAETFSASVDVRMLPSAPLDLEVETFSGDITVYPPAGARAAVRFDSFSGGLTSDFPLSVRTQRRGHLEADLNGGDPQRMLRLKTFSGDVRIEK